MKRILVFIGALMALVFPVMAFAATSSDSSNVLLAKGDNHSGTYYVAAQTLTIDGDVSGDVVCAGQTVVVNGSVGGDIICAAQTLTVNGPVTGSIRAGGQVVTINSSVGRNVTVGAQNFVLGTTAKVGGEIALAAATASLGGPIAQKAYVAASSLKLDSSIGGDLNAYVDAMSLTSTASLNGNLDYTSDQTFSIDKSKVGGRIARHAPAQPMRSQPNASDRLGMILYAIAAGLLSTLLAIWLIPRLVRSVSAAMTSNWQSSLGWGALALFVIPVAMLLLAFTFIGLPAAAVGFFFYIIVIMTSTLFAGVAVGKLAWQRVDTSQRGLSLAALVGVPFVILITKLPIIGAIAGLLICAWAMGGVILSLKRARSLG